MNNFSQGKKKIRGIKKDPYAKAKQSIEKQVSMNSVGNVGEKAGNKFKSKEYKKIGPKHSGHFGKPKSAALAVGKSKKYNNFRTGNSRQG